MVYEDIYFSYGLPLSAHYCSTRSFGALWRRPTFPTPPRFPRVASRGTSERSSNAAAIMVIEAAAAHFTNISFTVYYVPCITVT